MEVYRLLGIKAAKTTTYHPQADRQTEWVNRELEQYLRLFCSERQNDWADLLPMAEFQYNNHIHSSTQQTPFMLNCRQHPRMGFEPQQPSWLESANKFADQMKVATEEVKVALSKAKDDMARGGFRLPLTLWETWCTWTLPISRPPDHLRSFPIVGLAPSQSKDKSPTMCTSFSCLFQ